jgi:5-methylcytosine-specific restriction endonuclease McrA
MINKAKGSNSHRILSVGQKYNRLTILGFSHSDKRNRKWYKTKCDCGQEKTVMGSAMTSGNTKSCGCYGKELARKKRISNNYSEVTAIILGYKRHAISRGFEWLLTRDDVNKIIKQNCFYCGIQPSNVKKIKNTLGNGLSYSGIDRIDSSKNYTILNCVPCCKVCNYAKSDMSIQDFKKWAIQIGKRAIATQWS